jgi:uncharacterized membrane protein YtjA (UPF0391 family)
VFLLRCSVAKFGHAPSYSEPFICWWFSLSDEADIGAPRRRTRSGLQKQGRPSEAKTAARSRDGRHKDYDMLNLVVTLLIIALIAAVLGFGGIATAAVGIAKVIFLVALLLFAVAAIAGTMRTI